MTGPNDALTCRITYRDEQLNLGNLSGVLSDTRFLLADLIGRQSTFLTSPQIGDHSAGADDIGSLLAKALGPNPKRPGPPDPLEEQPVGAAAVAFQAAERCPVLRVSYASPLELIIGTPAVYVAAATSALLALPAIVKRFSKMRVDLAVNRLNRELVEVYREAILGDGDPEETRQMRNRQVSNKSAREIESAAIRAIMKIDAVETKPKGK